MPTNYAETVGATVRAEMARHRISQQELADKLHLSQTAVSRRLNGRKAFDIAELHVISEVVNVPISKLVAA